MRETGGFRMLGGRWAGTVIAMHPSTFRTRGLPMFGLGIVGVIILVIVILWLLGVIG